MIAFFFKLAYQIFVFLYGVSIRMASLWNPGAKAWNNGRKGQWDKLSAWDNECTSDHRIWMHCASSGEFQQGKPLLEKYLNSRKNVSIMVSFFSPSGYEQWKSDEIIDLAFYLPLDSRSNALRLIDTIKPSLVLMVKNEFWFNTVDIFCKSNIPIFFVNSIISPNDHIFLPFFRTVMKKVNHVFVQDKRSMASLRNKGFSEVTISGDSRIDHILAAKDQALISPLLMNLKNNFNICYVYGSVWEEDLKVIAPFINQRSDILHIIAPHDVSQENIRKCGSFIGVQYSLLSSARVEEHNIIIVDSIGHLKNIYGLANLVYIGGGFGKGIHNTLEPAAYFIPVIFGPKYEKFIEAKDFLNIGTAASIKTLEEFEKSSKILIDNKESIRLEMSQYFENNKGASEKIFKTLINLGYD